MKLQWNPGCPPVNTPAGSYRSNRFPSAIAQRRAVSQSEFFNGILEFRTT
jgi:hypothetical protein